MTTARDSTVSIALLYPELLGTYGDGGNALVLERRLTWRSISAEIVTVEAGSAVPETCDIYLLGGGEDGPQTEAARELGARSGDGPLHRAASRGAVVFAVCAGMQILGRSFPDSDGSVTAGLGLLDCTTVRTDEPRAVGELLADAESTAHLPILTGFENHGGRTILGPDAQPLGIVRAGVGNGDGTEGVATGAGDERRVLGSYLHGPALARNPALADHLLAWALGCTRGDLAPLADADVEAEALRSQRLRAVEHGALDGVADRSWRDRLLRRN